MVVLAEGGDPAASAAIDLYVEQLAFADRIVINKLDLVDADQLEEVERRVRAINGIAQLVHTTHGKVDLDAVIGIGAFDLGRALELDPAFLTESDHQHDASVTSVGFEVPGELDGSRLDAWLGTLLREQGTDIFRSKGILSIAGNPNRYVFQGVHMLFDGQDDRPWGPSEARSNKLVFIGRNLDREALASGLAACVAS